MTTEPDAIKCPCCDSEKTTHSDALKHEMYCEVCRCIWRESMREKPIPDATLLAYKEESIQLLCAAHQIAIRQGRDVSWDRFGVGVKKCLEMVGINNPVTARCYYDR
jgi:hypothetical protein